MSNPAFNEKTFQSLDAAPGDAMTLQGAINKTGICLFLLIASATMVWSQAFTPSGTISPLIYGVPLQVAAFGAALVGFLVALIVIFKKTSAPILAPAYSLLEGVVIGALSAIMESAYPNIVMQAVIASFGTLFGMLALYKLNILRATSGFRRGVCAATLGIALLYVASMVMSLFGKSIPFLHSNSWFGIGFSVFVVIVAAMNFILDFDLMDEGAAQGAPKYMEWYSAFALMVTLVWLYLEILRLLGKLRSRN